MPLIILIILGIIYGNKPAYEGGQYTFLEQSFGALSSVSICAGGLMGLLLLVAEYRERKILKRFKVPLISQTLILLVHRCLFFRCTLPYEMMPAKMQSIVNFMPMTQGIKVLKAAMLGESLEKVWPSIIVMLIIAGICSIVSIKCFRFT